MEDIVFNIPSKSIEKKENSKLLIVIHLEEHNENTVNFLTNIVKALKLDIVEDCTVVAMAPYEYNIGKVTTSYEHAIFFGLSPAQILFNMNIPLYKVITSSNTRMFFADPLSQIINDQTKKGVLWKSMQAMYKIG
jgi:hypothetical protein